MPSFGRSRRSLVGIAWYAPGTGLTRALAEVARELSRDWDVDVAGIHHRGATVDLHGARIHATSPDGDVLGAYRAVELARERDPEVVLCFNDVWCLERYPRLVRPAAPGARFVAWVPLDGGFADPEWARALLGYDLVAVYTAWAAAEVRCAWDACRVTEWDRPRLEVVAHGVDVAAFRPVPELVRGGYGSSGRAAARRRVFPSLPDPDDAFVVLNANRPDPRKRIDVTLDAFARFARGKPANVRLCLQHTVSSPERDAEIAGAARRLGIADRLILNPLARAGRIPPDAELNALYNACDVGLNTSMGEGWGLATFEHAAAGAVQVVPDHSACAELWEGHAILVPVSRRYVPDFSVLELAEVSSDAVAMALEVLFRHPALRARLAGESARYARHPRFRWQSVGRRWRELLEPDARRLTDERLADGRLVRAAREHAVPVRGDRQSRGDTDAGGRRARPSASGSGAVLAAVPR